MTESEKNAFILIRRKLASSRADIARLLGISRPTASSVVQSLLEAGMIIECGKGKSNGGTAPISLAVNSNKTFYAGIDLGYTEHMAAVLLDYSGAIIDHIEIKFSSSNMDDLADKLQSVIASFNQNHPVSGIAAAIPGIVDEENMSVLQSVNPHYCSNAIPDMFRKKFDIPFFIGNRSRMGLRE